MPVPQTGHFAFFACLPFFITTSSNWSTSLFARHFTQYIVTVAIVVFTPFQCFGNIASKTVLLSHLSILQIQLQEYGFLKGKIKTIVRQG